MSVSKARAKEHHGKSLAFDWIGKSYWFFLVIHIGIETRDYKWFNIEAFFQFVLVLINSEPVIARVQCDKLSRTFAQFG